ncbi:autotransporter outer membrane beta-barrel domain-containing protein [Fusobacterium varium]|uniref:autotransporter family protein n=1 Tax=Fusobacterium varium TaxID=856 RepID=UPI001F3FD20C|nr:autotransporter outer membrane beta-barrel domain-containing protein [Fusobacterium varium]MCF2674722.1 autotransporter outer membrane beta-barrel domain-containing protein [Fusobacterium varium]
MIEKIMKVVKSSNKRRGRNITIGTVIGFLLSCTAVAGADEYLYIKDNSGIQFSTDGTDFKDTNPYKDAGNIWDTGTNTYVNNIALSGTNNEASGEGYGVRLKLSSEGVKFINNGAISAESTSSNAYGIDNVAGSKISLMNNGTISASGDKAYTSGVSNSGTIENLDNSGIIVSATSNVIAGVLSHGIYNNTGIIDKLNNSGKIIGSSYGVINFTKGVGYAKIGILSNTGVIHGNYSALDNSSMESTIDAVNNYGTFIGKGSRTTSYGYGIWNMGPIVELNNIGVIYGIKKAIYNQGGTIDTANNYGILVNASDNLVYDGIINNMNNYGLVIRNEGVVIPITTGIGGEQDILFYDKDGKEVKRKMTIENKTDATGNTSFEGNQTNKILNILKNTYEVTGLNAEVTGSIINAYGTAVVFEGKDKKLTLSGTIVNGGIEDSTKGIAISGSTNGDNLILQSGTVQYTNGSKGIQNTIVNGNIDMGAGDDTLIIGDGTIVNGTLDGGNGADTLNFGVNGAKSNSSESEGVRILHNITGFENMNINTNVTLYEKTIDSNGALEELKVTDAAEIKIGENGTLTLRIDSTNKDNSSGIDKIIGHALYKNEGVISSTDGGKLLLALNGAGNQSIISFGDTKLNTSLVTEYEGVYYEDVTFGTTSLIHSVKRVNGTENEVEITVKKNLPLKTLKYEKLNKIYHGILSVEDLIGNFNVDTDEKLSTFLGYLNDIYAGNPYSYSSELSRKSVGMFRDIAVESQFKPELNKWLIMGGLTHVDGGTKDTYYGKGYYTYDIGSVDMDADTKITGAYMLGEYGVSDTLTYGVLIGGNKLKSNLSNGSKVDGDALYMGAYAKKYVGNLKVTGGLGLQYGDYDADRFAAGRGITETRSYSDNYNDMTYDIYLNGRYSHNIGNNLFLEPYGTLSYTYIKQDSADEGNKVLAIETNSKSFDYTAAKVGVDIKKVIPHEKGKSTLSAGVSYTRLLTGADEENITGRFKGGSDFDILVAHKNEHSIGLNAKYALELENGVLFDVKGSYNVERDSHNGNGKNRAKGEWIVGAGIGYKF